MQSLHRHLLTAGLLASLAVGAIAQVQTAPMPGPGGPRTMQGEPGRGGDAQRMEQFRARMQERMARRMNAFKETLQISPAQEGAWAAWTNAMRPAPMQRPDRAEFNRMTTPERIDRMRAMRAQRASEADRRGEATKAFYAQLNPTQKRVFDIESARFMGHRGGHGHEGHHGPRGGRDGGGWEHQRG